MSKLQIQQIIIKTVANQFDINSNKIQNSFNFKRDLDADSIDLIELVMNLENKFGMKIPDKDVQQLATVNDVVNYINAKQK